MHGIQRKKNVKSNQKGEKNRNQDRIKEDNRTASAQTSCGEVGKKYQMIITCHITDSLNAQPALMQAEFSII